LELISGIPFVSNIFHYSTARKQTRAISSITKIKQKIAILFRLRKTRYDAVIVPRRIYAKNSTIFVMASRSHLRIGSAPEMKSDFNIMITPDPNLHEVDHVFRYFQPLGLEAPDRKKFWITHKPETARRFQKYRGAILIHISADRADNSYPSEKIQAIIHSLAPAHVVITYAPSEEASAAKLSQTTHATALKTTIGEFIELMRACRFLISPDGGVTHIAAALEKPVISLFGSTENAKRWYPYAQKSLTLDSTSGSASDIPPEAIISTLQSHRLLEA